jgi:hypothetical protein
MTILLQKQGKNEKHLSRQFAGSSETNSRNLIKEKHVPF